MTKAHAIRNGDILHIYEGGVEHQLEAPVPRYESGAADKGALFAPMPGKIIQLLVGSNQQVKKGQPIVIMEAMKMEVTTSPTRDNFFSLFCVFCFCASLMPHTSIRFEVQRMVQSRVCIARWISL